MKKPRWLRVDSDTYRLAGTNDECMLLACTDGSWKIAVDFERGVAYESCALRVNGGALKAAKQRAERIWAALTEAIDGGE